MNHNEQIASLAGANGSMPFQLGAISTYVIGGPFRNFEKRRPGMGTPDLIGVCMAEELLGSCRHDIAVPTRDFDVPKVADVRRALVQLIAQMAIGRQAYVGCMGGIGRTGLLLAALAKIMGVEDPVAYVREHYIPHAVETQKQQDYIRDLPVDDIRRWAKFV